MSGGTKWETGRAEQSAACLRRNPNMEAVAGKEATGKTRPIVAVDTVTWPAFDDRQQQYLSLCKSGATL